MYKLFFLLLLLALTCPLSANVKILKIWGEVDFFKASQPLIVAEYEVIQEKKSSEDVLEFEAQAEKTTIYVGIFENSESLFSALYQQDFFVAQDPELKVKKIQIKDINQDGNEDLILDIEESNGDYIIDSISHFFLNTGDSFKEIPQKFSTKDYKFISPSTIELESELYAFGKPFEDTDDTPTNKLWRDYYEFRKEGIEQVNYRHKPMYRNIIKSTETKLAFVLDKIQQYKMDPKEPEKNQLQLNEYYYQVNQYKLLTQKCKEVLGSLTAR